MKNARPKQSGGRMRRAGAWVLAFGASLFVLVACGDPRPLSDSGVATPDREEELAVEPSRLSAFGNDPVYIQSSAFAFDQTALPAVSLASRLCLDVALVDDGRLRCLPQGSPESGPVWLSVRGENERVQAFGLLHLDAPQDRLFDRFAAIGGSWTAGMQSGSLTPDGQRTGVAAWLARQAGAYFPMPLLKRPGLPRAATLADLDPLTGRLPADWQSAALENLDEALENLRADPDLRVQNFAVPEAGTPGQFLGSEEPGSAGRLWQNLLLDPFGEHAADWTRLTLLKELKPTLLFAGFDLVDYIHQRPVGADSGLREDAIMAEFEVLFDMLLTGSSPPVLVVMNLPPAGFWPGRDYSEWQRYESIWINNALFEAGLLAQARHPDARIVLVDSFSFVFQMLAVRGDVTRFGQSAKLVEGANGETDLLVTDRAGREQRLGFDPFEGIFSFDWLTLSASGNALFANLVIETLNRDVGPKAAEPLMARELAYADLAAALADDPLAPGALQDAGAENRLADLERFADLEALPGLHVAQRCAMHFTDEIRPDPADCPVSLIVNGGQAVSARSNVAVEIVVDVFSYDRKPLGAYPLAVHVRSGFVSEGPLVTDEKGRVRFRYTGVQAGYDTLTIACGSQIQRVQIPVEE
jgi:hypothetical protein